MKAIGFFFAVFLSMLAVFLVATGEVTRWLAPTDATEIDWEVRRATDEAGKNMLDFEFWDVKEGRRRFIIRAELNQEALHGSDPLGELKTISLRSGVIELPLQKSGEDADAEKPARAHELVLHFKTAIYSKGDGLAGKKPLNIRLYDGHGETTEGTRFFFEELLFSQSGTDKGRFRINSDKPVRISKPPYLEVRGPGLRGLLTDRGGFRSLIFPAPVHTFLEPGVFDVFSLGSGAAPGEEVPEGQKIAAICKGPLHIQFRMPALSRGEHAEDNENDEAEGMKTRITFKKDVVFYQIDKIPDSTAALPAPKGNRFECQKLQLEIGSAGGRPNPEYAIATWPGNRVRGYHVRGSDEFRLDGERLEWFSRQKDGQPIDPESLEKNPGEAVLSGKPRLVGKNVAFDAERAVLRPKENTIRLENVSGTFLREKGTKRTMETSAEGARPWSSDAVAAAEPGTPFEKVNLKADEVDIVFAKQGSSHALSHFVARSADPRGVVIVGEDASDAGTAVRALGHRLRYEENRRRLILTGTPEERPRLTFGDSWIEATRIVLFRDEGHAWFEQSVRAQFEKDSTALLAERAGGDPKEFGKLPDLFDIEADFLEMRRKQGRVSAALARGSASDPVVLTIVPEKVDEKRFRFLAPEVQFDAEKRHVELFGSNDDGGRALARMEFDGGEVRAGKIRFEQKDHVCFLRDSVDVRLFAESASAGASVGAPSREERLRLQSDKADVTFFEGFKAVESADSAGEGPLGRLSIVKKMHAVAEDGGRLLVTGKDFTMRGEQATWENEAQELRFFGREMQEIQLEHEQVRGPIVAREIVFSAPTHTATLTGSVIGKLSQPARARAEDAPTSLKTEPFVWDFETSALDVVLAPGGDVAVADGSDVPTVNETTSDSSSLPSGASYRLHEVRARDKVVLRNEENGVKLLGDDLLYEHEKRSIRVFSEEGRLQTLMRQRTKDAPKDGHDEILAREIFVFLYDDPAGPASAVAPASPSRLVVVQFQREVKASFAVALPGRVLKPDADQWKVEANSLVLHIDPEADPGSPQIVPLAIASGNVVASSGQFRASGNRAEYTEDRRELRLEGSPASVTDFRLDATTTLPVIVVRKVGELIHVEDPKVQRRRRARSER